VGAEGVPRGSKAILMGRVLLVLPLALARSELLLRYVRAKAPRFETLEECEEAYDKLLGVPSVQTEPEYDTTTTSTTVTTEPPPTTTEPAYAPFVPKEVGKPERTEAKEAYEPPATGTGKPDSINGWDYKEHGDDWPSLPNGGSCGGDQQSPIDIVKYVDIAGQTKSVLWFDYYKDPELTNVSIAELVNDGHGITFSDQSHLFDLGYVKLGNDEFAALEYEFHVPSEHTLDGQVFPLEIQVLHKKGDKLLAIGVLFKYGKSNPYLAALMNAANGSLPVWTKAGTANFLVSHGMDPDFFDLEAILPSGKHVHPGKDLTFYNYPGSLTQPPCTEGVDWWVTAEPVEATKEEIGALRKAIMSAEPTKKGNNRNAQAIGSRQILVGHTGFQHHVKHYGHKKATAPASRGYVTQDLPWQNATHWTMI
jgi:carbonic anhydrase